MAEKKKCVVCGVEFTPRSPSQKICGNIECQKERRRQYMRKHAKMYRELNKLYRQKEEVKQYRAEYDREYQQTHKQQIQQYKKLYYQKKRFMQHLENGKLLKNIYWFSLSKEEQEQALDKIKV